MGAHSTINITRSAAREYVFKKVFNIDDEKLEEMLDDLLYERLYNVRIVNDDESNEDYIIKGY